MTVLSHNVWCHYIVPAPGRMRRLRGLARYIKQASTPFDVVMLQELFVMRIGPWVWSREFEFFRGEMAAAGLKYCTDPFDSMPSFGSLRRLRVQNSGLVTFSRYPIVQARSYSFETTSEMTNTKGLLLTELQVPATEAATAVDVPQTARVQCVNTHLDSRKWEDKQAQIEEIAQHISSDCTGGDIVVATGDWNVTSETSQFDFLFLTLCGVCPNLVDTMGLRYHGTMRRTVHPKPWLYLNQLTCQAARFYEPPTRTSEAMLDHTFVGAMPRSRGAAALPSQSSNHSGTTTAPAYASAATESEWEPRVVSCGVVDVRVDGREMEDGGTKRPGRGRGRGRIVDAGGEAVSDHRGIVSLIALVPVSSDTKGDAAM